MVKTRAKSNAKINQKTMLDTLKIFGRTLTLRTTTRTLDQFGQLSAISTSDETFTGDLQYGVNLDQQLISAGYIEVGDGVLYYKIGELSSTPEPQDIIIDGNAEWEIVDNIESQDIEGTTIFIKYRCKRRINSGD